MICPSCSEDNVHTIDHIDLGKLEEWVFCPDCRWQGLFSEIKEETDGIHNRSSDTNSLGDLRADRHTEQQAIIYFATTCDQNHITVVTPRRTFENVSRESFDRLCTVMYHLWEMGRAIPGFPQGGLSWEVL